MSKDPVQAASPEWIIISKMSLKQWIYQCYEGVYLHTYICKCNIYHLQINKTKFIVLLKFQLLPMTPLFHKKQNCCEKNNQISNTFWWMFMMWWLRTWLRCTISLILKKKLQKCKYIEVQFHETPSGFFRSFCAALLSLAQFSKHPKEPFPLWITEALKWPKFGTDRESWELLLKRLQTSDF